MRADRRMRCKVNVWLTLAEKVAWAKAMAEIEMFGSMCYNIKDVMQIAHSYWFKGDKIVELYGGLKMPPTTPLILDDNYKGDTVISLSLFDGERIHWRKLLYHSKYTSTSELIKASVRHILFGIDMDA